MNKKQPTSKQIAIAMTRKMLAKFDELSKAPKLTPDELKELVRLRQALSVVKQRGGSRRNNIRRRRLILFLKVKYYG